jgi:condensin complex subunit 3
MPSSLTVCSFLLFSRRTASEYWITEDFWRGLTPEKAFLIRVFVDHCVSTKENNRLEKVLPVVTAHAFRIQEAYNTLLDVLDGAETGGDDEAVDEHEFILAELLRIALNLDYADEIGRRRLEQFVRMYYFYSSVEFL